jgi:TyrR family helix-turn-helix protein
MRVEIKSKDRLGISQEILSIFAHKQWDIFAVEVVSHFIYVQFQKSNIYLPDVLQSLSHIDDVLYCKAVDLLPTQRREAHLQTLLNKIPDPIIDIDQFGCIIAINSATRDLLYNTKSKDLGRANTDIENIDGGCIKENTIEGVNIERYIDCSFASLLTKQNSFSILFCDKAYLADITPIVADNNTFGIVLTLRTMHSVGKQISLLQNTEQNQENNAIDNIIGENSVMQILKAQTLRFAELDLPVLISGETGTGKELIARALHNESKRADAPFLVINCATLPENLLESELFGYASGAFTGAQKGGKPGLFELAEGGTVFLDEIAEMSIYLQAKLLRFLQDYSYRRLGGIKELTANVRIISASHQNLNEKIEQQKFREDLFYRLNVLNLSLPALRERKDDIDLLASYFIKNSALQVEQALPHLSSDGLYALKSYHWPGNIRQLQNTLFRVVALNTTGDINKDDIEAALVQFIPATNKLALRNSVVNNAENDRLNDYNQYPNWVSAQEKFEHDLLEALYPLFPSTRKLAERLGVSHNKIATKLRKYHLN